MLFNNENNFFQQEENFFTKLIKTDKDLMQLETHLKNKKIKLMKFSKLDFIVEKFHKLLLPLFSISIIIFLYYFYIYVNNYF